MAVVVKMQDYDNSRTELVSVSVFPGVIRVNPKTTVIKKGGTVKIPLGVEVHVPEDCECEVVLSDALISNRSVEYATLAMHCDKNLDGSHTMTGSVNIVAKRDMTLNSLNTIAFIKHKEKPLDD